jgi:hypothetical protein
MLLFPDRKGKLGLDAIQMENLLEYLRKLYKESYKYISYSARAACFLSLFPDRRGDIQLEGVRDGSDYSLAYDYKTKKWRRFVEEAIERLYIFPGSKEFLELYGGVFEKICQELEKHQGDYMSFAKLATYTVLLFPDRKSEIRIPEKIFEKLRDGITNWKRQLNSNRVYLHVFCLHILSSQHAEIDATGKLVITPRTPRIMAEPRPLPERSAA